MLYEIKDGSVSLGGEEILSHFDFEIRGREKIAILGSNGTGKTTLCRVLAGELAPDADDARPAGGVSRSRSFTVGYLRQEAVKHPDWTVEQEKEELIRQVLEKQESEWMPSGEALAMRYDRETALIEKEFRAWFGLRFFPGGHGEADRCFFRRGADEDRDDPAVPAPAGCPDTR